MMLILLAEIAHAADEAAPGFTMREIWDHSGPLAKGVIVLLALMLLTTLIVSVERRLWFRRGRVQSMALAARIVKPMQDGDIPAALKLAKDEAYKSSYLAPLLAAGLAELDGRLDRFGIANAQRAVEKAIGAEVGKAKRGMAILATVGSTAPFVGLFGTTFGVINAFQGMATGGGGLSSISAGISEALITTGVGIGVAVFGVWLFNYFNTWIEKVQDELASSEIDFLDWAEKLVAEQAQGAPAKATEPVAGK